MSLTPGQIINNRYPIVKLLGQGGFGAVYRAWDINLERPVALKENLDASVEAERQFKREAKMLVDLAHPNLPRVFDSFTLPGQGQYLVMDFIEGEDLQQMLDRSGGPLTEAQVLPWMAQVCDALSYLHSQNPSIIHRDVKPANIKVRPDGRAMLVDFGIAKRYDPHMRTTSAARAVTPGYSPPEQYGLGRTDVRTDVYALGATLYALLTGQTPPDSHDVLTGDLPPSRPAHEVNPVVSPAVSAAIAEAMQLERGRRFQSAEAFKTALTSSPIPTISTTLSAGPSLPLPGGGGKGGTVVVPPQPSAVTPKLVAPTAVIPPVAAKPVLPAGAWLGAIGAVVVVLLCLLAGPQLWKALVGGIDSTTSSTEAALLTHTATLTSTPTEPVLFEMPTVILPPSLTPILPPTATPIPTEIFITTPSTLLMNYVCVINIESGDTLIGLLKDSYSDHSYPYYIYDCSKVNLECRQVAIMRNVGEVAVKIRSNYWLQIPNVNSEQECLIKNTLYDKKTIIWAKVVE